MRENVSPLISQLSHQPRRSNLVSSCGLNVYVHPARELLLQDSGSQDKGGVHKEVCVMLNVKLLGGGGRMGEGGGGGGGVACGDVIKLHILVPHVCYS